MSKKKNTLINKFISAATVGMGFSISFVLVLTLWIRYFLPVTYISDPVFQSYEGSVTIPVNEEYPFIENFFELSVDQKIANSTAILVTKVTKDDEGIYRTTVEEILKKDGNVDLYYEVGDLFEDYNDYNADEQEGKFVPKGFIVFMSGNPAQMIYSTSYSGDRIGGLGGISMELLREKCNSL